MKTNQFYKLLIFTITILFSSTVNATHITSTFINCTYMDTNQYLITAYVHRDCNSIPAPTSVSVCYSSVSLGISDTVLLTPTFSTGYSILITNCFTPPPPCFPYGIEEWTYANAVVLPQAATDWVFGFWVSGIFSGDPNSTSDVYVNATLNNVDYPVNSTPFFNNQGYTYYCLNIFNNINFSCVDADGDSLAYYLVGAMEGINDCPAAPTPVVYPLPYSATYPLSSSSPINIDSITGLFYFTPSAIEIRPVCIRVDEYRNGVLIASSTRNNVITILPTSSAAIEENNKFFSISVQPNPFNTTLNITTDRNQNLHFQLFDIAGRKLMEHDINASIKLNTEHLDNGIYFYHVSDNNNNFADGKIIKD